MQEISVSIEQFLLLRNSYYSFSLEKLKFTAFHLCLNFGLISPSLLFKLLHKLKYTECYMSITTSLIFRYLSLSYVK